MRTRVPAVLLMSLLVTVLVMPGTALAHGPERPWDGTFAPMVEAIVTTDADAVDITRISDNVEFIAHVDVGGPTSDMQFQRREGLQILNGEVIDRRLDLVVQGGTDTVGAAVTDITDPTNPVHLTSTTCGGFHSDIAIYENYLLQGWDSSTRPCAAGDAWDPDGVDRDPKGNPLEGTGVRIFDITDPAKPRLVRRITSGDIGLGSAHNITVNNEAGLLYLNMAQFNSVDPGWAYVDLNDPKLPLTVESIRDWSPTAGDGCHDSAILPAGVRPDLGEDRVLYSCPGITASYIWDITDPRNPVEVAYIPNPSIGIHHGGRFAPDGNVMVLGDELAGAAVGAPEQTCAAIGGATAANSTIGATWFYNITVPQAPVPVATFSVTDEQAAYCTSHFYNFYDQDEAAGGRNLMIGGWYDAGIEIVDYTAVAGGLPGVPTSYAVFEPAESGFFSAYEWNGYVYGSSFEYGAAGKDKDSPGRGLWIIKVDGIDDTPENSPLAVDEGIVHGRWNAELNSDTYEVGDLVELVGGELVPFEAHTEIPTDAIALGSVAFSALAFLPRRGRRRP